MKFRYTGYKSSNRSGCSSCGSRGRVGSSSFVMNYTLNLPHTGLKTVHLNEVFTVNNADVGYIHQINQVIGQVVFQMVNE